MKSLYDIFMLPIEKSGLRKLRKKMIPYAQGNVLEVGSGTGVNLSYYEFDNVKELIFTDVKLSKTIHKLKHPKLTIREANVQNLPFENNTFDTVVHTLVFCSVDDVMVGLHEIKRVLKPEGKLIFIEHVEPKNRKLNKLFHFINPLWKNCSGGCSLVRDYISTLSQANFIIDHTVSAMKDVFISGIATKK